jgi:hypothetical protein
MKNSDKEIRNILTIKIHTMKTKETSYFLIIVAAFGLMLTGCTKDKLPASVLPLTETLKAQNSDVQDAIAEKNEMEIDNTLDQIQVANYSNSALKDAMLSGSRTITVDHPDSTTFPKVITIVYNNFQDSTANESFIKNGEIDVTVTAGGVSNQLVTRVQVFKDFSITTDSTTVTVSGTRTVTRTGIIINLTGMTSLRVVATDHILAYLNFVITRTGVSDSLKFTRVASKIRNAYLHFNNIGGMTWQTVRFRNVPEHDTITWSANITGLNEMNESYTKVVTANDPITMIFYKGTPVLASGTMLLTIEGNTATSSYTITFKEDPDHLHMTLVTVKNNETLKTRTFIRRFSRKFVKWWV